MNPTVFYLGIFLVAYAIIGGAVKLAGVGEFPGIKSIPRQLLLAALGAVLVAWQTTPCDLNLNGTYTIRQSNGESVVLALKQSDQHVSGTAKDVNTEGDVSGTATRRSASLLIEWRLPQHPQGTYDFSVDDNGKLVSGSTQAYAQASGSAGLKSDDTFCTKNYWKLLSAFLMPASS